MNPTLTQPENIADTLSKVKTRLQELQPTVSAADLANPTPQVQITPVGEPKQPDVSGTVSNVLGSIRSISDSAKKLAEEQAAFQSFADTQSGFDIQNQQLERFGVTPKKLERLEDIQLQLSDASTANALQKAQIEGAAGQTLGQAQREITQQDREAAIRSAGLAAEAAVLQGNIETGRSLARDAVTIALADREFQANAILQNIQDLKEVVNEETRQLLVKEERKYTEDIANINRAKSLIDSAVGSGYLAGDKLASIVAIKDPVAQAEQVQSIIAQNIQKEIAAARAAAGAAKPPEMKNFGTSDNPVWKQWNPSTSSWTDVTGVSGNTGTDGQDSLAQFSFLRDSAQRILGNEELGYDPLYKASGKGVWDRTAGFFVGDSKYNRLETQTDTLRTNMLTLMADPNVKKFFGPQMSNNDVKLMASAATTLRPESQSPEEIQDEVIRIDDLINRAETAVRMGLAAEQGQAVVGGTYGGNYVTAPDGTQIEIID